MPVAADIIDITPAGPHMTPFGPIPREYKNLKKLCTIAHIACRKETHRLPKILPKDALPEDKQALRLNPVFVTVTSESWHIVQDNHLVPTTYKTSTGKSKKNDKFMVKAANDHLRFQMLLDYITWKVHGAFRSFSKIRPSKTQILDVCIGEAAGVKLPDGQTLVLDADVRKYSLFSWQMMNNICADAGIPGYSLRGSQDQHDVSLTAASLEGAIKAENYGAEQLPF